MNLRGMIRNAAVQVVRQLVENGFEAYIVGGAVRDLLLGSAPKDYDITTNATPEQVREVFGRRQCMIIGRRFRLAMVRMGDDVYEVSTFRRAPTLDERKGRYDDDGQMIWNDNQYGTLEDDALRRDFTVNALYYDPIGDRGIIDMVGGVADLQQRVVRVIGDPATRFVEDPVRMLRALKLVGIHGFTMTPDTVKALNEKRGLIQRASISRLYEELLKIFMTGHTLSILNAFQRHGFLACFWPSFDTLWDTTAGRMSRRLLLARDQEMRSGRYTNSRALALSTACLPIVLHELQPDDEGEQRDWSHGPGMSFNCLQMIRSFYDSFVIPRDYTLRVKEIILMVPALCDEELAPSYYHHSDYRYARLLVGLLVRGLGWDEELFERLPEPDIAITLPHPHRRRRRSRRAKR